MKLKFPLFFLLILLLLFLNRILATQVNNVSVSVGIVVSPELKLKVYKDFSCTETLSSIDWGELHPKDRKTYLIFLRNEGNIAFILYLSTDNWYPLEAQEYIFPTWDYNNETIFPNEVKEISLILSISSEIKGITTFSFDFIIIGEQYEGKRTT